MAEEIDALFAKAAAARRGGGGGGGGVTDGDNVRGGGGRVEEGRGSSGSRIRHVTRGVPRIARGDLDLVRLGLGLG